MNVEWTDEELDALLDASVDNEVGPNNGFLFAAEEPWGSGRWLGYTMYIVTDRDTGEHWGRVWEYGLTESQDHRGWQDDWHRMRPQEVVRIKWKEIE